MGIFNQEKGQALVQVLVASAIAAVVMASMMSFQVHMTRENLALTQVLARLDFQNQLTRSLSDGTTCKNILAGSSPFKFNSSVLHNQSSFPLALSELKAGTGATAIVIAKPGEPISPNAPTLVVDKTNPFEIVGITGSSDGTTGIYKAWLQVNLDASSLVRPMRAPSTAIFIKTQTSGSMEKVTDCNSSESSGGGSSCAPIDYTAIVQTPVQYCANYAGGRCNPGTTMLSCTVHLHIDGADHMQAAKITQTDASNSLCTGNGASAGTPRYASTANPQSATCISGKFYPFAPIQ